MLKQLYLLTTIYNRGHNNNIIPPKFTIIGIYNYTIYPLSTHVKNIFCVKLCYKNSNNLHILVFYRKFADYLC